MVLHRLRVEVGPVGDPLPRSHVALVPVGCSGGKAARTVWAHASFRAVRSAPYRHLRDVAWGAERPSVPPARKPPTH